MKVLYHFLLVLHYYAHENVLHHHQFKNKKKNGYENAPDLQYLHRLRFALLHLHSAVGH